MSTYNNYNYRIMKIIIILNIFIIIINTHSHTQSIITITFVLMITHSCVHMPALNHHHYYNNNYYYNYKYIHVVLVCGQTVRKATIQCVFVGLYMFVADVDKGLRRTQTPNSEPAI